MIFYHNKGDWRAPNTHVKMLDKALHPSYLLVEEYKAVSRLHSLSQLINPTDFHGEIYLGDFEEFTDSIHSYEKLLVQVEGLATLFLVHIEILF